MTIHAVAYIHVTNPEKMAAYREKGADALAKHGGTVIQASPELVVLEGDMSVPTLAAILAFPDRDAAMAWHNDPDLQDTHALRQGSGVSNIVLFGA
ncbi:DUF1330 domain-containing protein [uncultured Litoreibacter sp.]|uniref:DUF1330 domain-containing protein n=1 Tax=uncultured Litoreibacter sp. TaxID=1392394 RepID=UPI00261FBC1C|nr:DUF1330 domain-containing protein [uncultured Litoreibacter sp.]